MALPTTLLALSLMSCSAVRGDAEETGMGERNGPSAVAAVQNSSREVVAKETVEAPAAVEAISFEATELFTGERVFGADILGRGRTIATFVQPGCVISVDDAPTMAESAEANPDIEYVFVHSGGTLEAFERFVADSGLSQDNVTHLADLDGAVSARFGVLAYPWTLLVDSDVELASVSGALDDDRLERANEWVRG